MKLNEDKCHFMIFGAKRSNATTIKIGKAGVKESAEENLLGITFDQSLSFKQHVQVKRLAKNSMLLLEYRDTWAQKIAVVNEGVRFVSFQLLPACLDAL